MHIGDIGDSRAYLKARGTFRQVTKIHDFAQFNVERGYYKSREEYWESSVRSKPVLFGFLRDSENIGLDISVHQVETPLTLLLCTDGLWAYVNAETIADAVHQDVSCQQICDELVAKANEAGGYNNSP